MAAAADQPAAHAGDVDALRSTERDARFCGGLPARRGRARRTTDGSVGVLVTGVLDLKLFTAIVECIPEGTWEFVCHPGYSDAALDQVRTRLRQSREQELALLTSPEAKDLLQRRGIELISYHEL